MVFLAFLGQQLYDNLRIRLACEDGVFEVGIAQLLVIYDCSVVHEIVVVGLVEVGVCVVRGLVPAGSPAGMPDADEAALVVLDGLVDYLLDAVFLLLNGVFGEVGLDFVRGLPVEGDDASTIVPTVL